MSSYCFNGLYDLSSPYESHDTPSAHYVRHNGSEQRFNPYEAVYSQPSTSSYQPHREIDQEPVSRMAKPTVARQSARRKSARPTAVAAAATRPVEYKNKDAKNKRNARKDYLFDPEAVLYEDSTLAKICPHNGKKQFWYFLLSLLMDPSQKKAVQWTGRGREFILVFINSIPQLCLLWSSSQGLTGTVKHDSMLRNMRAAYDRKIMVPVGGLKNSRYDAVCVRINKGLEQPSLHVDLTRDELTQFITEHGTNESASSAVNPTPPPSVNGSDSSVAVPNPYDSVTPPPTTHQEFGSFFTQPLPVLHLTQFDQQYAAPPPPSQFDAFLNQPLPVLDLDTLDPFFTRHPLVVPNTDYQSHAEYLDFVDMIIHD